MLLLTAFNFFSDPILSYLLTEKFAAYEGSESPAIHFATSPSWRSAWNAKTIKERRRAVSTLVFAMTIARPFGSRPQRKTNFSANTMPIGIHVCNFFNSSFVTQILMQGAHIPLAGRMARLAGCLAHPSTSTYGNGTCFFSWVFAINRTSTFKKDRPKCSSKSVKN